LRSAARTHLGTIHLRLHVVVLQLLLDCVASYQVAASTASTSYELTWSVRRRDELGLSVCFGGFNLLKWIPHPFIVYYAKLSGTKCK